MLALKKRWIVYVLIFLVVMLPLEQAYAADPVSSAGGQVIDRTRSIPQDLARQGEAIRDELLDDVTGVVDSPEDLIGEDIIVQVEDYQPKIIRSSLLEDSGIFVHALLSGTPTNPTVTIPRIRNIAIRNQKVTTVPQGIPISVGRITHVTPSNKDLSYSNLGTIVIPIRQIPKEGKVPDEIILDVNARIFFDVSEGLYFGPIKDILAEQGFDEWKLTREDHSFYAGYLQATEIKGDKASFMVYDNQLNELTTSPITLTVGQTSRSMRANSGGPSASRLFDRYTLRLDSIKGIGDKVRLLVNKNGNAQTVYVTEGEDLFAGSPWFVESIATDVKKTSLEVLLRNKLTRAGVSLVAKKAEVPRRPEQMVKQEQEKQTEKEKEKLEQFKKLSEDYYKLADDKKIVLRDFDAIRERATTDFLNDPALTLSLREQVLMLLGQIRGYYAQKRVEFEARANIEKTEEAKNLAKQAQEKFEAVDKLLKERQGTKTLPVATGVSDDPTVLYRLAIAEYEKVISNYPTVKNRAAAAHWKIANLAPREGIKDYQGASNHLEILLRNYKPEDYAGITDKITIQLLLNLLNNLQPDFQSIATKLEDRASADVVYVTLLGGEAVPDNVKSKATIEVEAAPTQDYREGQQLLQDDKDALKWYVKEIKDTEVVLQEERTKQIEIIGKNQQRQLSTGTNKKRSVRVLKTDAKKEAHITIAPNTEVAFSEAVFSLHLPIEKRALDLPLFSDSFEEEIAKTEDLLASLDKIIGTLGKITEYWKKFCFITFAVVWVKNFVSGVFGGTGALARERANNAFEKKYNDYRALSADDKRSCKNMGFDECVFKNQAEYDRMVDEADAALGDVAKGNYKDEFKDTLGKEYADAKKDMGYYESLVKKDPSNQAYRDKYYELHARLQRAEFEKTFTEKYFAQGEARIKSYDELGEAEAKELAEKYREKLKEKKLIKGDEEAAYIWRTQKERFLPLERDEQIKRQMRAYLEKAETDLKPILGSPKNNIPGANNDAKYLEQLKESYGLVTVTDLGDFKHNPSVTVMEKGRQKGYAEFISIDAFHYMQVTYTTGGRVARYDLYKRSEPNGHMGGPGDVYRGVVDSQMISQYKKAAREKEGDPKLPEEMERAQKCIGDINKKNAGGKYSRGEAIPLPSVDCGGLGSYVIDTAATSIGPSCTEFMSPTDCKLLFNACDPVICPPSRCNLAGEWQVDNVIQTGIIGSAALCLHNNIISKSFQAGGVVMPVCLSGIYAGLQNLRSVIEGYRQCLITAKVSGRSVGICDRIRSFGICELLWKEGLAIFNTKKGLARMIFDVFRGSDKTGGSEYSTFEKAVDNSVGGLQYFTQSYAKNTFAMYSGGALPELGTEICKAAIFGKAPGIGNLFDQISKPESPPQFTAFFDEAPYSDLGNQPLSQYKVTYHLYAGDNEDIMYTVYMQTVDPYTGMFLIQPHILKDSKGIIRNRRLARGTFASESPDLILPAGMKEICVEMNSRIYGRKVECGFGKVSTGFALNYLSDQLAQSEAKKQINSAEECVPKSSPSITELGIRQGDIGGAALGSVSSGFITTGIIRKCSKYNPGVGGDEEKWSPVGSCGEDDRERDLGTCWLYVPAAQNAIKEVSARLDLNTSLARTADEAIQKAEEQGKQIPGYYRLTKEQIQEKMAAAQAAVGGDKFEIARSRYQEILGTALIETELGAEVQYLLAKSYELEALKHTKTAAQEGQQPPPPTTGEAPQIISITPSSITNDKETRVTLKGKNFKKESTVKMESVSGGYTIVKSEYRDEGEITLIMPKPLEEYKKAILGTYKITVMNKDNEESNAVLLTIIEKKPVVQSTKTCKITGWFGEQQYWGDEEGNPLRALKKKQGETVTINLKAENCGDEKFIIEIFENNDYSRDKHVATFLQENIEKNGDKIKVTWRTKHIDDATWGIPWLNTDPEMIVKVYSREDLEKEIFEGKQEFTVLKEVAAKKPENQKKKACIIRNPIWVDKDNRFMVEAEAGDQVNMMFEIKDCKGEEITVTVSELQKGALPEQKLKTITAKVSQENMILPLTLEWQIEGTTNYLYTIKQGNLELKSAVLTVYPKGPPEGRRTKPVAENDNAKWRWIYRGKTYEISVDIPPGMYEMYKAKPHPGQEIDDFAYYVLEPGDDEFIEDITKKLNSLLAKEGISNVEEKTYFASAFTQGNFVFKSDEETKKCKEYPRYPIELLVDGAGDCEDAAILTASLLQKMNVDVVMIDLDPREGYKGGHYALAIACNPPKGYFVRDKEGKAYCYFESSLYKEECHADLKKAYNTGLPIGCVDALGEISSDLRKKLDTEHAALIKLEPKAFLSVVSDLKPSKDDKTVYVKDSEVQIKNLGYITANNIQIAVIITGIDKGLFSTTKERVGRFPLPPIAQLKVREEKTIPIKFEFKKPDDGFEVDLEIRENNMQRRIRKDISAKY